MSGMRDSRIGTSLYNIETLQRALERAEARVAELVRARGSLARDVTEHREMRHRAEADRDAALDLLRDLEPNYGVEYEDRVRAFLARVDSGTEPK